MALKHASNIILISLVALFSMNVMADDVAPSSPRMFHSRTGRMRMGANGGCGSKKSSVSADRVKAMVNERFGNNKAKAECYIKLYTAETSINAACEQGHVPNPPGIGLCTLEGNPAQRNRRGGKCKVSNQTLTADNEEGVKAQMDCCEEIMKKDGNKYFEPVQNGKVPNCETS